MKEAGNRIKKFSGLITQLFFVLLLIIAVSLWLRNANLMRFPAFIENLLSSGDENMHSYIENGYEIFEYISRESEKEITRVYPSENPGNISKILEALDTYDNYFWENTSTVYYGNKSTSRHTKSRVSRNRYNIEMLDGNYNMLKRCVSDGERVSISDNVNYRESTNAYRQGIIDFYSEASVISLDYFKDLDFENLSSEIYRVNESEYNLLSINYSYEENGTVYKNNYMVSLDFGVVLFAECYENDSLVYSLKTDSIYSLPSLDDDIFEIN